MKKAILLTISLMFAISFCFAQQINQTDAQGRKQGIWKKNYSNGAVRYTGQFKDNHPYGVFKYYFPTGKISAVSVYSHKGAVAHIKSYHLNGKLMATGKFVDRKKDSVWNYYSETDGKLVAKENYLNGKKNGKAVVFYPSSGTPAEITHYKKGLKEGEWLKYFPNDSIYIHGFYHYDTLEGPYKVYGIDGHIQIEGRYVKGLQSGTWITYDSTGKVLYKQVFKQGVLLKESKR